MRELTERRVEAAWCRLFDIGRSQLWRGVTTLQPHGVLGDYEGWFVAWRKGGVHISAPSSASADDVARFASTSVAELQEPACWADFARRRGLRMVGPATHGYLDQDPGPVDGVVELTDLESMRGSVSEEEWLEAGLAHDPQAALAFGVVEADRPVAVAVLNDWDGEPRDVGVLVVPDARRRGLATAVGRHAASYAVRQTGLVRWRAATSNVASARAAGRIGFEPYATQLAMRA